MRAWTDVRTARDGTVTHLWGTAMDITAEQEHAARLRSSEEHFRVAFEMAPIGMSMISLAPERPGAYLSSNTAFQRMLGRDAEELHGLGILSLTPPEDRVRDRALFGQLLRGEELLARLREALPACRRRTSCTPGSPAWSCTAWTASGSTCSPTPSTSASGCTSRPSSSGSP